NLLSNAFKFTEAGGVDLRVCAEGVDGAWLTFEVTDSGIGITAEEQDVIFEAFRQADGSTHRKYGGTGLGLSISRDLARLLGGEVSVQSEAGKGSLFTLRLPLKYAGPTLVERSAQTGVMVSPGLLEPEPPIAGIVPVLPAYTPAPLASACTSAPDLGPPQVE